MARSDDSLIIIKNGFPLYIGFKFVSCIHVSLPYIYIYIYIMLRPTIIILQHTQHVTLLYMRLQVANNTSMHIALYSKVGIECLMFSFNITLDYHICTHIYIYER